MASLAISLTVNTLVTGLSVFKIFKVYWETRRTSEERKLGVDGANNKLRSIIFLIIESGMAMFTVQLIRIATLKHDAVYFIVGIYQMFMVIIELVTFSFFIFTEIILGINTYHHLCASVNRIIFP